MLRNGVDKAYVVRTPSHDPLYPHRHSLVKLLREFGSALDFEVEDEMRGPRMDVLCIALYTKVKENSNAEESAESNKD